MIKPLIIAFGSRVSGKSVSTSDYDFAVVAVEKLSLSERVSISENIAKKMEIKEDKIDLVDLSSASPLLKFEVARNGKLIDGDYAQFIRFKVRAFKEYVDTAKFRRLRERVMMTKYA